jgi:superfamily I DNA and RNA helicase
MGDTSFDWDEYQKDASETPKVTDREIFEQLVRSNGNMSHAARALGIPRKRMYDRVQEVPALQALKRDLVDEILDTAEDNIFSGVRARDATDTRFVLQTLGKERGWSQGVAGTGKNGEVLVTITHLSGDKPDEPG